LANRDRRIAIGLSEARKAGGKVPKKTTGTKKKTAQKAPLAEDGGE